MAKQLSSILVIFLLLPLGIRQQPDTQPQALRQFDLLTASSGWVQINQRIFWTEDSGQSWQEITPVLSVEDHLLDVFFLDSNHGWVLFRSSESSGTQSYHLAGTSTHGQTWYTEEIPIQGNGISTVLSDTVQMVWTSPQNGWIAFKHFNGTNFNSGTLLTTSDGGRGWQQSPMPVTGKLLVRDTEQGIVIRGPTGSQVFRTMNSGATWEEIGPADLAYQADIALFLPGHNSDRSTLYLVEVDPASFIQLYLSNDFGTTWSLQDQLALKLTSASLTSPGTNAEEFVATIPDSTLILAVVDGRLEIKENRDSLSASITEVDMAGPSSGWGKWVYGKCSKASASCSSETRLLHTNDGGLTWNNVILPGVEADLLTKTYTMTDNNLTAGDAASGMNTSILIGHGFDICEIPSIAQMKTWWDNSPYEAVNLYIGGSARACPNSLLSAAFLEQLSAQGWKFIPTWVGPQAPCTGYSSRFSYNVTTAYNQGAAEANSAAGTLSVLGLTNPDQSDSIVYYDMEYYGTDTTCRNAANAFMNGWVSQLHSLGITAGVYGSTLCSTGLSDFWSITHRPDAIWPARWYHNSPDGYFDPDASVWGLGSCLTDSMWAEHQRIRQYEGTHNETWGTLTLAIDNDVLDGIVAVPNTTPYVTSILLADPSPTSAASVDFTVNFSEPVTGVDTSTPFADLTLVTTGLSGASITAVSGSQDSFTVTVDTGAGSGTIRLDMIDDGSIQDLGGNPLEGGFTSGETYMVEKIGPQVAADFDGDGDTDISVYRPSNGYWYAYGQTAVWWGLSTDRPVPGDYDADG
ncbi:MAG: DUF1906 domain-containing protein, partial [Anaerolineales bacterium]|nr:DUF1906 domain-containing protein [Anaerolineales bacterium]